MADEIDLTEHDYSPSEYQRRIDSLKEHNAPSIGYQAAHEKALKQHREEDSLGAQVERIGEKVPFFKKWFTHLPLEGYYNIHNKAHYNFSTRDTDRLNKTIEFINYATHNNPTLLSKFKSHTFDPLVHFEQEKLHATKPQTIEIKDMPTWNKIAKLHKIPLKRSKTEWAYRPLEKMPIYLVMKDKDGIRHEILTRIDRVEDKDNHWHIQLSKEGEEHPATEYKGGSKIVKYPQLDAYSKGYTDSATYKVENPYLSDTPEYTMYETGKYDTNKYLPFGTSAPHLIKGQYGNKTAENFDKLYPEMKKSRTGFLEFSRMNHPMISVSTPYNYGVPLPNFEDYKVKNKNVLYDAIESIAAKRFYSELFKEHENIHSPEFDKHNGERDKRKVLFNNILTNTAREFFDPQHTMEENIDHINEYTHPETKIDKQNGSIIRLLASDKYARQLYDKHKGDFDKIFNAGNNDQEIERDINNYLMNLYHEQRLPDIVGTHISNVAEQILVNYMAQRNRENK